MNFERLRIFAEVARLGGFTRAAGALYLSQSNVSTQVGLLERELGTPLFRRMGRRVSLTEPGETLYRHARQIFALAGEAEDALRGLQALERGTLRVGGSMTPGVYILPSLLGRFRQRHPGLRLQLTIGNSAQVRGLVRQGELDVGIVGQPMPDERDLVQDAVLDDELLLVVPPGHAWAARDRIEPAALAETELIMREPGSGTRATIEAALSAQGHHVVAGMEIGSIEAIKLAVRAGLGVSILSCWAVGEELARGNLLAVRLAGIRIQRQFYILYPQVRLAGAGGAFVRFLKEEAGQ